MARRKAFYLSRRTKKHGRYWYVSYINLETGKQMTAKSVEVLRERLGIVSIEPVVYRDDACIIAQKALEAGLVFASDSQQPFDTYCKTFWDYDTSGYVKRKNQHKPDTIGKEYCINMLSNYVHNAALFLPQGIRLCEVRTRHIEDMISCLFSEKQLSSGTIAQVLLSISIPLREAHRLGMIPINPAARIESIARQTKEKGTFTLKELQEIGKKVQDLDKAYALAISLALSTGMRMGEVRALQAKDILQTGMKDEDGNLLDKVNVCASIAPYTGLKGTKGKYNRYLCIPHSLGEELRLRAQEDPGRSGFVFWNSRSRGVLTDTTIRKTFYKVLDAIGIDSRQRKKRNLTFHSLRHSFSTIGKDERISMEDRMMIMGHRSESMEKHYTHVTDAQLMRVGGLSTQLFDYCQVHK